MASDGEKLASEDVAHASDFETPLHHGVLRYVPGPGVPADVRASLPVKNDRKYVYVPVGFLSREPNRVEKVLSALDLKLPNLVIVTAEAGADAGEGEGEGEGDEDAGCDNYRVQNAADHPVARDWTEDHTAEVLRAKVGQLLRSTLDSGIEVGAWIVPQCPRRRDGGTRVVCEALSNLGDGDPYVALGVLGLDERDEDDGLTASVKSNMVPLGSPVRAVTKIDYDATLKDNAPCPELTHLLVFESPHDKARFGQELLDLVPDILLGFGDITRSAMRSVFDNTLAGSPIVLLKHTGNNIDALCRMFKHVKDHIAEVNAAKKKRANSEGKGTKFGGLFKKVETKVAEISPLSHKPGQTPLDQTHANSAGRQVMTIPPIPDEQDELIRLFINTWPSNFNDQSVVLADPLLLNGPTFQKRILSAITATFDLKTGGEEMQQSKRRALEYAWSFYDIAHRHAKLRKCSSEKLHVQLVSCTLLSIVASIFYDQVYGGSGHPTPGFQLFVFVLTILLPLYITSLKQESDNNNPVVRWAAFSVAAARLESEIYKFRAQVGPYRAADKTERSLQEPLRHFSKKTQEIWTGIKQFLHDDGMEITDDFWEYSDPDAEEKEEEQSEEKKGTSTRKGKSKDGKDGSQRDVPPDETTPMLGTDDDCSDKGHSAVDEAHDDEDPPEDVFVDDRFSPIVADEYIDRRMKRKMRAKAEKLQQMVDRNDKINHTIKMVTIFSGATAALSLQWCVPIILGVTAALGTGQEFRKYQRRIELGNTMIVQLNEIKLWWMGLSMYQRQLPHNKDRLIQNAEHIIMTEIASSFDGQSADNDAE